MTSKSIWAVYDGPPDDRDTAMELIMARFSSAKWEGGGFDFVAGERDQSWSIDEDQAAAAKTALEAAGFRVRLHGRAGH
jgi:hypothetical protein